MPYLGYVESELIVPDLNLEDTLPCLLLVVADSRYNLSVPILLGTNVLSTLMERCKSALGPRFLQKASVHTPWYLSFRNMAVCEKELAKNDWRLGLVKSAEDRKIVIPANTQVIVQGYVDKEINYPQALATLTAKSQCNYFI